MSDRANRGVGIDGRANGSRRIGSRANPSCPVDEMFASRHGQVTPARLELISRAEGLRPHPGWGCAL